MNSKINSMFTRLETKMGQQLGYRGDLFIADHKSINKNTSKLLLGYNTDLGQPKFTDIAKFVVKTFEGRIVPNLETARIYTQDGAIAVIACKVRPCRPLEDKEKMVCIAATIYLDQDLGDKWELEKDGDSLKLARVDDEQISDIVAQRMSRMQIQASTITFNNLKGAMCTVSPQPGDKVQYYKDNNIKEGVIISAGPVKCTIKAADGTTNVVNKTSVFDIMNSGKSKTEHLKVLREYYNEAYPKPYGKIYIDMVSDQMKA